MTSTPSNSRYTQLVNQLIFPLHERLKKHHSSSLLKNLEISQWYSPELLQDIQNQNLQHFMAKIYSSVPFYRQLFDQQRIRADSIRQANDLQQLPLLDKATIRQAGQEMVNQNHGKLVRYNTGGSSGEPLIFYMGMDRVSHDVAAKWRATRWWGVDIGDKEAVIWGSPIELGKQDRIKLLRDKLLRSHLIPAFDLHPQSILQYLRKLQTMKPLMIFGYPSVIHQLVQSAEQQQVDLSSLEVKVVFTTSEMLYPHQRQAIETAFQAPVANGYGARDAGFIAHECPEGQLHISSEDIIVEIVDNTGKALPIGCSGEIVITHLGSADFPFVRYRTGDRGRLSKSPCPCGRGLPVLAEVEGRSTDFLTATDGSQIHALAIIYILREVDGIEQFKVTQTAADHVEVQVKADELTNHNQQQIISAIQQRLGRDMTVNLSTTNQIARSANGKFRYVENLYQPTSAS